MILARGKYLEIKASLHLFHESILFLGKDENRVLAQSRSENENSIDSWNKCKDAFISNYFPPAKIITLRNDIMKFKQLDHEHVAQSWERMKLMFAIALLMV